MPRSRPPESFLPLKPPIFHALLALSREERHGYALLKDIQERSGEFLKLMPAALYRHLQRMLDDGLIEESARRPAVEDDQRRRYYKVTSLGKRTLEAELRRLERILVRARGDLRPEGA